jgi:hypothetical protein
VAHTETFDFVGKYSNGEEVKEVTQGDVTITFGKGTAQSNVPKYYNTGTAIRCYPKNTITVEGSNMTQIDFTFGSGDSNNPITADVGTFTNTRWTGAADKVVFTIGGSSNHRRIAGMAVTTNGESAITTYDRYITSCQTTEEFENVVSDAPARKILIGGQIYILVGETIYTITGIPVSQINEIMK